MAAVLGLSMVIQVSNASATRRDTPPAAPDRWIVLHTRSRQEKAVGRQLAATRQEYRLPLVRRVTATSNSHRKVTVPLFPGYVFLHGQPEAAYEAVSSKRVCQILEVRDQARLEAELADVMRAVESQPLVERYIGIPPGTHCRVVRGPLKGVEGHVLDERNARSTRLILSVDMLGQGASVEIERDFLEPLA